MRTDKNVRRTDPSLDRGSGALDRISQLPRNVSRAFVFQFSPDDPAVHAHSHGQLAYSPRDPILVSTEAFSFVALPATAVWIPPKTRHRVLSRARRRMLNLYLAPSLCAALPRAPTALPTSALLIELMQALSRSSDRTRSAYCRSLAHAVSVEVLRLNGVDRNSTDIVLPQPKQRHLKNIAEALAMNPSDRRRLNEWAKAFGKSPKTVAREIKRDLGITFREWQLVCKMHEARERLRAGESVKSIAFGLGYSNPNTLVASFRRLFGITPGSIKAK